MTDLQTLEQRDESKPHAHNILIAMRNLDTIIPLVPERLAPYEALIGCQREDIRSLLKALEGLVADVPGAREYLGFTKE